MPEGPTVKVSVVVPVYNPGEHIEPLIRSLRRQSMPAAEFEAVFVDDGSTDETPGRLDALAEAASNVRVVHQPNSGWPGKPRNVGIDAAHGEFVQFVDQDDELDPEALDRLYRRAVETDSDVVLGKVVGRGRSVPVNVYRTREDHATLERHPLVSTLSPHKLFRKRMLDEHRIRFPEGKRRLEDHPFVLRCYFAARNIAILADHPCYYFTRRSDAENTSFQQFDPAGYFRNVEDSIDVVEANTEPGRLRNKLLSRFYRNEMLMRLREPVVFNLPDDYRKELFEQTRQLGARRFPDAVPDGLPLPNRLRSILLREGRLDDMVEFARRCGNVHARARVSHLRTAGRRLELELTARMGFGDDGDLCWTPSGDRFRLDGRLVDGLFGPEAEVDREKVLGQVTFDLTLRNRKTSVEWWIPTSVSPELVPVSGHDGGAVEVTATATVDPAALFGGRPLPAGLWDFYAHLSFGGLARSTRLAGPAWAPTPLAAPTDMGDVMPSVEPYLTETYGNLSLDVGDRRRPKQPAKQEPEPAAPKPEQATGSGGRIRRGLARRLRRLRKTVRRLTGGVRR
ncbi:MAG: glycosyltransferase family 2 protein [Acidothermales bacterium]|nr:glycosyltransferase family 2 protein [Acidothermales bacterium]